MVVTRYSFVVFFCVQPWFWWSTVAGLFVGMVWSHHFWGWLVIVVHTINHHKFEQRWVVQTIPIGGFFIYVVILLSFFLAPILLAQYYGVFSCPVRLQEFQRNWNHSPSEAMTPNKSPEYTYIRIYVYIYTYPIDITLFFLRLIHPPRWMIPQIVHPKAVRNTFHSRIPNTSPYSNDASPNTYIDIYIYIYIHIIHPTNFDKSPINPQHIFQIYPLNISPTGQLSEGAASGARSAMAAAGSRVSSGGNGWWIVSICLAGGIFIQCI